MITGRFGNHPHPVLKGIMVQNNGIDIQAEASAGVKVYSMVLLHLSQKSPGMIIWS
jgi:hypothetical protein